MAETTEGLTLGTDSLLGALGGAIVGGGAAAALLFPKVRVMAGGVVGVYSATL